MSSPLVYLILGAAGSGRREILSGLMAEGLAPEARPLLLSSAAEMPPHDATPNLLTGTWARRDDGGISADVPDGATHVFFLTDGRASPVDQVEVFHAWLPQAGLELTRVITVVNCQLALAHRELQRWYDACVHFSDVVLLNRRESVPNKWISDFTGRLAKQHLPCLVEFVKQGSLENPALVLEPQARRISMLFDEPDEWSVPDGGEVADEDDDEKSDAGDVDDKDLIGAVDPYLERLAGSGRRAKEIPDIAKFLALHDDAGAHPTPPP